MKYFYAVTSKVPPVEPKESDLNIADYDDIQSYNLVKKSNQEMYETNLELFKQGNYTVVKSIESIEDKLLAEQDPDFLRWISPTVFHQYDSIHSLHIARALTDIESELKQILDPYTGKTMDNIIINKIVVSIKKMLDESKPIKTNE